MSKTLLFIVNDPGFFLSHRLPVAKGAQAAGYKVHVACMPGAAVAAITAQGFEFHPVPLSRSGRNPLAELGLMFTIWKLLWRLKPDVLHLVTIKPVLYGGVAARFAPVKGVVTAISGLGFVFLSKGIKAVLIRRLVSAFYRLALGKGNLRSIFQNPDDRDLLLAMGGLTEAKVVMIRGSGVDLALYAPVPEPQGLPVVCLAARLLRDKGVVEYVEAARVLTKRGVQARFQLIGGVDPGNPATVTKAELDTWRQEGIVELLGYRDDIAQLFSDANIVTLPSYREGLPKVLVEAAACGRAVVTTDVPGCRDAIDAGVTGLLVPVRDANALADQLQLLIEDPALRRQMGVAGRELAVQSFAIEKIVEQHLEVYRQLERTA
ncbi:glycosyltransferase involved in cell wall biosynthesis [Pseudomonas sp. SJZ103]|uniref:glycosyltransferase family 4 protein n=1 Tax=unclassified Pseudomonas TaxID=196821 RepID=UPI00119CF0C1|nr:MULTISPECIES: glycosyltransferase family 4 protein [unclassified Pseudomonas]MBB6287770.1 glycosyltransferase involved in cell wall biosynthesis [Pseudomonas sp. SJZ073]MBB6312742.1 glycosyltransferase involved in cell wall biosynthesis [Pseudomonas sp. JAI120]TWC75323.1 glycosyltransferase involved in cell wall biosynthesis [Pseudomonas sp. SJZ103]TWC92549.1 glycosyltransferase involved in cell wall biosynthesis [Pseudomonas sp. SJZ094]